MKSIKGRKRKFCAKSDVVNKRNKPLGPSTQSCPWFRRHNDFSSPSHYSYITNEKKVASTRNSAIPAESDAHATKSSGCPSNSFLSASNPQNPFFVLYAGRRKGEICTRDKHREGIGYSREIWDGQQAIFEICVAV